MPQSKKGKYSARLSNAKESGSHESFRTHDSFYRMMVDSLNGYSVFTTDKKGNISSWNTGSEKLFGYKEKEAIGKNFSIIFTDEDIKKSIPRKELEMAEKKGKVINERNHVKKDGTIFWASGLAYPLKDEKSIHRGFSFILIDHSKEKELDKRRDDFISTATHELKTPITSMKLFAEIVQRQTKKTGTKAEKESVKELSIQLDRLTALMNYLLDVAKIQQGKLELNKTSFNANSFIEETILMIKNISINRTINFTKNTDKKIYADKERLTQVLTNLISNAIKYSATGKEIIVNSAQNKNNVVVSVQDFGLGIPKSEQKLVFNRFYRANSAIDHDIGGIGLGLYVAKQIVQAHHGRIWVKSVEQQGSTFYFSIPVKNRL